MVIFSVLLGAERYGERATGAEGNKKWSFPTQV